MILSISDCKIIPFQNINEYNGNKINYHCPFNIKRVFYLYNIPPGEERGAHAHRECHQLLVPINGSFEVIIDDGSKREIILLNKPDFGLYIPPGIWAEERLFSKNSVCLVFTSHIYDESDYIREYDEYIEYIKIHNCI